MDPEYEVWDNIVSEFKQALGNQSSETTHAIEEHPVIRATTHTIEEHPVIRAVKQHTQ